MNWFRYFDKKQYCGLNNRKYNINKYNNVSTSGNCIVLPSGAIQPFKVKRAKKYE